MAKSKQSRSSRGELASGRELAFLVLCHLESYDEDEREDAVALFWRDPPGAPRAAEAGDDADVVAQAHAWSRQPTVRAFAERIVSEMVSRWSEVDALIEKTSRSWRVARMDRVDRNALRLAVVELANIPETPRAVVLSEVVRLASRYGSERSGRFVNGVAEALARALRPRKQQ